MSRDPKTSSLLRTFLVYIAVLAVGAIIIAKAVIVQTKEGDELRQLAEQVRPAQGRVRQRVVRS